MKSPKDSVTVRAGRHFGGILQVPGDKSISHRVAMFSALAEGLSTVEGFLFSEDCICTYRAMEAMGAEVVREADDRLKVTGTGGTFRPPPGVLDMGNSGTGIRLVAGLIAGAGIHAEMTGDASLCSRPMNRIAVPLREMGARISLLGDHGRPPVRIAPARLRAIDYHLPMASAQVKSCVLLAGLFAEGTTRVTEPARSRDHTERILNMLGLPVRVDGLSVALDGFGPAGPRFKGRHWIVPGDFSSAAFFIVAAAGMPGAELTVKSVGLNPRRAALLDVLKRMGADIQICNLNQHQAGEPVGDVMVRGARLSGTDVFGDEVPALIDEIPILSVAAAVAEGRTVIRDAAELRVKESDRIAVMVRNLRLMGVRAEETPDGMIVEGPSQLIPSQPLESFGDHRVVMSMAVLALYCKSPVCILNTTCVNTSYPTYWNHLRELGADFD
ncbi:MAG TPA: 3-phosphoshikimate 1-carboxyvinyltransferase [Kiritimatiellia bacterium]|nr:3-phosphoshikimate 1-carboxyvinyltransferase [Kiritimatiellia bacterium]HPA77666.1 3-phosphoshikimate 1-carboxyvinyltransferase [Kiritimatiellia bacterium]HQQ03729.1 3-phosphoshikimate 1-carboxyvinyltransferase [Kiritimatiellia bacterium]